MVQMKIRSDRHLFCISPRVYIIFKEPKLEIITEGIIYPHFLYICISHNFFSAGINGATV